MKKVGIVMFLIPADGTMVPAARTLPHDEALKFEQQIIAHPYFVRVGTHSYKVTDTADAAMAELNAMIVPPEVEDVGTKPTLTKPPVSEQTQDIPTDPVVEPPAETPAESVPVAPAVSEAVAV